MIAPPASEPTPSCLNRLAGHATGRTGSPRVSLFSVRVPVLSVRSTSTPASSSIATRRRQEEALEVADGLGFPDESCGLAEEGLSAGGMDQRAGVAPTDDQAGEHRVPGLAGGRQRLAGQRGLIGLDRAPRAAARRPARCHRAHGVFSAVIAFPASPTASCRTARWRSRGSSSTATRRQAPGRARSSPNRDASLSRLQRSHFARVALRQRLTRS